MEAKIGLNFKGNYHIELIDSITGKIKQEENIHNLGCVGILKSMAMVSDGRDNSPLIVSDLLLGSGSGTPSKTDTGLFSQLWSVDGNILSSRFINNYTAECIKQYTFPATSAYVSDNITELGLKGSRALYTHALFTDSEGQPISIQKTDLDILIVTVTIEISFSSGDGFYIYPRCALLQGAVNYGNIISKSGTAWNTGFWNDGGGIYSMPTYRGQYSLIKYDEDINYMIQNIPEKLNAFCSYNIDIGLGWNGTMRNSNTAVLTYSKRRIPTTTITTNNYFRGVGSQYMGAFLLPNEDILPTYTISNIPIGTGDGITTEFENPFSYFKENTEQIYVDNQLLTRNIDYTINHIGNKDKFFDICQNIKPVSTLNDLKSNDEIWGSCNYYLSKMFRPNQCAKAPISLIDTSTECYGINADNPVVLDFGISKTFNFIRGYNIRLLRKDKNNGNFSLTTTNANITIEYSNDNLNWSESGSVQITSNQISIDPKTLENPNGFEEATARYWRLSTDLISEDSTYYYLIVITPSGQQVNNETCGIALGYYDPMIVFTNAPSDGSEIKMNVGMDVIFKNNKFVTDITSTYIFTI